MTKIKNLILLNNEVPIRLINEPFCKKCMNPVSQDSDLCKSCEEFTHSLVTDCYFNRIISLGLYKTYENENYNNIPLNVISRMILLLKGKVKKHKKDVGEYIADGLLKMIKKYSFLMGDFTYLLIPPKDNPSEENQCKFFLKPLMDKLNQEGYDFENITSKLKRVKSIGKNREKPSMEERFEDIKGIHDLGELDLQNKKVLILDDVVTSKATIWDIARALKEKNAGEINILSVGRTFLSSNNIMEEDIPSYLDFNELLTFFSNLDNVLESKNIKNVRIKESKIEEDKFICKTEKYNIEIDFRNRILKHNCNDFFQRRYKNKTFCKHLSKFFLEIREMKGEEFTRKVLYNLYKNILHWAFIYND